MSIKLMDNKRLSILASALFLASMAHAVDYTWSNDSTAQKSWADLANWQSGGTAAADLPTNATDSAAFPALGDSAVRTVSVFVNSNNKDTVNENWALGTLTGGPSWQLRFLGGNHQYGHYKRTFTIGDVTGFEGEWTSAGARQVLKLTADEQTLKFVRPDHQFSIEVANADQTARIEYLYGDSGAVAKEGPGTLSLGTASDSDRLQLQVNAGAVELRGELEDVGLLYSKAALHLDASEPTTLLGYEQDGRQYVTNWLSKMSGSDRKAETWDNSGDKTASHVHEIHAPFISSVRSSTGLPLLDFGAADEANVATYGPTGCVLRLTERLENVKELFYVAMITDGIAVLGDTTDVTLNGTAKNAFSDADAIVANGGFARFNGNPYMPELVESGGKLRILRQTDKHTPTATGALQLINVRQDVALTYLGSDRLYRTNLRSGGVRIGEVIAFSEALTEGERQDLANHLMKKWFATYPRRDFGTAYVAANATINVPAGHTARVSTLSSRGPFVKTGGGVLEIGRLEPANTQIEMRGGSVRVLSETRPVATTAAPAGTPQFWYDADAAEAFNVDAQGKVLNWYDCRSDYRTARQASKLELSKVTDYPSVDTTTLSGHTVLDFPASAALTMPTRVASKDMLQREIFMVFSFTTAEAAAENNHIGAGGYTTDRNGYKFYDPASADDQIASGVFTINGVPIDPFEPDDGTTFAAGRWFVVSGAYADEIFVNRIGSNSNRNHLGDIKIGEIITYDVELTDDERRQTTAYLMKKWLNADHPETTIPETADLVFPSDAPATLVSDDPATYRSVTGGNGTLVKAGEGSVTVTRELADAMRTLKVTSGELHVARTQTPPDRSTFHFDASAADSFKTFTVDGNGVTNVTELGDVRDNGVLAVKSTHAKMNYLAPKVVHVEMPDGVTRPVFDFGNYQNRTENAAECKCAGFDFSVAYDSIVEAHVIFRDGVKNDGVTRAAPNVFNGVGSTAYEYSRGKSAKLLRTDAATYAAASVTNGYVAVDGVEVSPNVAMDTNFHLISMAPTAGTQINALGNDRGTNAGGSQQAEILGFTEYLSTVERGYLQGALMHKWLGAPAPVWTNELDAVEVGANATLTVAAGALSVAKVKGGGSISSARVVNVEELELTAEDGRVQPLVVNGQLGFADEVTVRLNGDRLKVGTYDLVAATSLEEVDLSRWQFVPEVKGAELIRQDNIIQLRINPRGLLMILH